MLWVTGHWPLEYNRCGSCATRHEAARSDSVEYKVEPWTEACSGLNRWVCDWVFNLAVSCVVWFNFQWNMDWFLTFAFCHWLFVWLYDPQKFKPFIKNVIKYASLENSEVINMTDCFPPYTFCPLQQDEESPGHSPPGSPPAFPDEDPEAGFQFRRRAHTFSHPPVKKRISFDGQLPIQNKQTPLRRQQSVNPELLQSR